MSIKDLIKDKIFKCSSLSRLINNNLTENFDLTSEENDRKSNLKNFEEIFNNNYETELKAYLINNKSNKSKSIYNNYEINNFNFFIICKTESDDNNNLKIINSQKIRINQIINKDNQKRGRKRKRDNMDENDNNDELKTHNKFSDDNLRKKCKNIVLKNTLEFINEKIKELFKDKIGYGKFKKELKILDQEKKVKSTVTFDKSFIKKTLKEIFSGDISARFFNFPRNYNKIIIESLIEDSIDERRKFFIKLFNMTFIDCLKYFREDKEALLIGELNGLKKISSIKEELITEHGNDYVDTFINYLQNFEEIINNKRGRKRRKEKMKQKFNLLVNKNMK